MQPGRSTANPLFGVILRLPNHGKLAISSALQHFRVDTFLFGRLSISDEFRKLRARLGLGFE